jgi:hypothetical protein
MNTAILIGEGREATALRRRANSLSGNLVLFETNLSGTKRKNTGLPVVDIFHKQRARKALLGRKISRVVMVGLLRPTGPQVDEGEPTRRLAQLSVEIFKAKDPGDGTRKYIHLLLKSDFKFPAVKSVLPFLFHNDGSGVNPRPDLLEKALARSGRSNKCFKITVAGEFAKVFRIEDGNTTDLFNCCLAPKRLEQLHINESIKRFFFDRNRTIIIDYKRMAAYARKNGLTLESFG